MKREIARNAFHLNRRQTLLGLSGVVAVQLVPTSLFATPEEMQAAIRESFGDAPIQPGRVAMKMPALSENGNSVPLSIDVDSPMTAQDHVSSIQVFTEKNPLPNVAKYYLGPRSGKASIATRIRLADTQIITTIAQMSDGSLWSGTAETIVTLAACIDLG